MSIDLRIPLHKLEVITLVVQLGGVGRAADHLHVAQPVVSAHIRSLEERLGTKLFYRDGRQLQLTESGEIVHAWAKDVLTRTRELDRHLSGLSGGVSGTVHFGASMSVGSYVLPLVLTAFRRQYPQADLRLSISDTEHAIEDTRSGLVDFAVVVSDTAPELPGMDIQKIGEDEIVLLAAPDGEPSADHVDLIDLAQLPFIEAHGVIRRTFVDKQLRELGVVERNIVLQLGHPEAMKRAAQDGIGVTLLFRTAAVEELQQGSLREIHIQGADLQVPIFVISRKGKSFSPLHLQLIEAIRQALADRKLPG
jgi:LysR family transcriptional regulator, low CO2-responsive transcriptional regulator